VSSKLFGVTYEITTQESAENGDCDERGFIADHCSLRDAVTYFHETRTNEVDGVECIEANEWPMRNPRWITIVNGMEFRTGAQESRSLHMPKHLTSATRRRIARLLGAK
jgi:hypothetical protein